MNKLPDLIAQRDALNKAIEEARKTELAEAIARVRTIVAEYGLSAGDVFSGKRRGGAAKQSGPKVKSAAPKYRDPATGKTWTGHGRAPAWIDGKDKAGFAI